MNLFDAFVAVVLGAMGIALGVILAMDGGTVVEILLVLLLFGALVLRWVAHACSWASIWRR